MWIQDLIPVNAAIDVLKDKVKQLRTDVDELIDRADGVDKRLDKIEAFNVEIDSRVTLLEQCCIDVKLSIAAIEQAQATADQAATDLAATVSSQAGPIQALTTAVQNNTSDINDNQQDIAAVNTRIDNLP